MLSEKNMLYKLSKRRLFFFILRMVCVFAQIYLDVDMDMYILHIHLFEVTINAALGCSVESSALLMFWEESIFIFRVV